MFEDGSSFLWRLKTITAAPEMLRGTARPSWSGFAHFRFQLHFCIFAYWTRKEKKKNTTKQNAIWVCFPLLWSFCFLTCRTLSLLQLLRACLRYLNMCFEDFQRKWGFSHLLLTRLGLVRTRGTEGDGEGMGEPPVSRPPLGAFKVGSSSSKWQVYA